MPRLTLKYRQALATLQKVGGYSASKRMRVDHDDLYRYLAECGYHWNADIQAFLKGQQSTSAFADTFGNDTGEFRVRVTANRETANALTAFLEEALPAFGYRVTEVSNAEPNRSGAGVRVYIKGKTNPKKRSKK